MPDRELDDTVRARLTRLAPPPVAPVDARGDWRAVEDTLGTRLPADYRWLVETYGWGEFADVLYLRTPFGTSPYNHVDRFRPDTAPGPLLVWGGSIDADRLCWLVSGAPADWPVVVRGRAGEHETYAGGTAVFLEGWLAGRIDSPLLGAMEPDLAPWFNAFRPRAHRCLRLSQGSADHEERLRRLREALAPTVDRGAWRADDGGAGQDHFATVGTDWLLTYDMTRPHQIRVGFPPEDGDRVRERLFAAVRHMGCRVVAVTDAAGVSLPAWGGAAG
ncbi:hypothetical protein J3486_05240 [Streptomyces sp. VRA16 Mangrove soil]|nr:hypothetical protein [Streptomyces sp. VRA16 Mangrove soil]